MKIDTKAYKKNLYLTAAGVALQMLGGTCLFLAVVGTIKEIDAHIKQVLIEKLSK